MILTLKKQGTDIDSAYRIGLRLLEDSYKKGKIFSALPKETAPLSWFEPLCIPAMSPKARREIVREYLSLKKHQPVKVIGTFAWAIINIIESYNDNEKAVLEDYFVKYEEYFDSKIDTEGLLRTDLKEGWLSQGTRTGAMIEDQALYKKILDVLSLLTNDDMYEFKKKRLIRAIRENMDGAYVLDRKDSLEVRPSNFVAAFFAPELFRKNDWKKTFDTALRRTELWCDWGGLRSLSRSDMGYREERDGLSWFFINNMAGTVLSRLDKLKYGQAVDKISAASAKNILWQEHSGRPCEVTFSEGSNIKVQGLYGLSLATFIYLYRIANLHSNTECTV